MKLVDTLLQIWHRDGSNMQVTYETSDTTVSIWSINVQSSVHILSKCDAVYGFFGEMQ